MKHQQTIKRPEFICIGAGKAGTTWLHDNLKYKFNVNLPPVKELNVLYDIELNRSFSWYRFIFGSHWLDRQGRDLLIKSIPKRVSKKTISDFLWMVKFTMHRRTLSADSVKKYCELFKDLNQPTGDISPMYTYLSEEVIRLITNEIPGIKVIFLLRDPAEREWSSAKMVLAKHKNRQLSMVKADEFLEFFDSEPTDYIQTIERWLKFIPSSQLHIDFFENIVKNPREVIQKASNFIGLEADITATELLNNRNKGLSGSLEDYPHYSKLLYTKYGGQIHRCHDFFKETEFAVFTQRWIERSAQHLDSEQPS